MKVGQGSRWKPPTASEWNAMQEAAEYVRQLRLGVGGGPQYQPVPTDLIKIKNSSGASRSRGHVLEITGILEATFSRLRMAFDGGAPTPSSDKRYAILKEDIPNGGIGLAQVSGICAAVVNVTDSAHKYAKITASTYSLQSSLHGIIPLVYQPSGTGSTHECAVLFAGYYPTTRYEGQMQGALATSDSTKTVDNLVPIDGLGGLSSVTAYNRHGWESDDNAVVRIEWNQNQSRWEIYQVTCPA